MNPILKNILAVLAGAIIGGILNGIIINVSGSIITPPEGANLKTLEGLKAAMHLMQPKHFILPFLAHALGTFVGAILTVKIAANRHLLLALIVGSLFLLGGIANVIMLPSPLWFTLLDLTGAYIPMAYLAFKLAKTTT